MRGNIVTKCKEKAEVLKLRYSVFHNKTGRLQDSCSVELVDWDGKQNGLPVIQEEAVSDLLSHLDAHKSMGPDNIHLRIMRELAEALTVLLSIISHQSWLTREVAGHWKVANVKPIHKTRQKEDPGNYRPFSLTSVPDRVMEQFILSAITQHKQDNQGIRPSQHRLKKGRPCLTNLMSFNDQVTCLVDEGKAVGITYLDFSKAFEMSPIALSWKN